MAETQEALDVLAAQHLAAGLQIDVQVLGVVVVEHALGHIHLQAPQGIPEAPDHRQVDQDVVLHGPTELAAELLLHQLGPAIGQEGIGLEGAVALGGDVGVAGHLDQLGDTVLHPQGVHHIGVATAHIGAQDHHLLGAGAGPTAERIHQLVVGPHRGALQQQMQRCRQHDARPEPQGDGLEHRPAFIPQGVGGAAGHRENLCQPAQGPLDCLGFTAAAPHRPAAPPAPATGSRRRRRPGSVAHGCRSPRCGPAPSPQFDRRGARWRGDGRSPGWCARP